MQHRLSHSSSASPASLPRRADVSILGDGVVGHVLALLLAQAGKRVILVQDNPPPPTPALDHRAYALNERSKRILQAIRCWFTDSQHITPIQQMDVWGDQASHITFAPPTPDDALAWVIPASALMQNLKTAVQYASNIQIIAADEQTIIQTPLEAICEGKYSKKRDELGLHWENIKSFGHTAMAARLQCEHSHGGVARQWFIQPHAQSTWEGSPTHAEILALLPIGGSEGRQVALIWSVEHTFAKTIQAQDPQQTLAWLNRRCQQQHPLGTLQWDSPCQYWSLKSGYADRWYTQTHHPLGGWQTHVLVGDAAHGVHPLAGQGLNLGLADADNLVTILKNQPYWRSLNDLKPMRQYQRSRSADVQTMRWLTDHLFDLFAHPDPRMAWLRNAGLRGVGRLPWLSQQLIQRANQGI